jgi:uncharacterized membrane protein
MLFATPEALAHLAAPWAKFYSHSKPAATVVTFLHIAPIVIGGGFGIFLDRATLRVDRADLASGERHLAELHAVHPFVIGALVVSFTSGVALLAADLDTFLGSWVFWLKMALVVLLLANGGYMTALEGALRRATSEPASDAGVIRSAELWWRLRLVAVASLILWLTITFAGVVLANIA